MIVLDTHMWIWFNMNHPRLPALIEEKASECVISVASVWEVIMLVERGRIETGFGPAETPRKWLERYPFRVLDLDYRSVELSRTLEFEHEDPADRFIAATAFRYGATLATVDARLHNRPWLKTVC
jgi:PIN domain nuclease of toxin-antitoxin system